MTLGFEALAINIERTKTIKHKKISIYLAISAVISYEAEYIAFLKN
jgi:hypothetical protein